ncbi:MAG: hypothetical protein HRT61_22685, partial [Ekhidna sp.]|nr:hypothetical protein [Ekhidna sp.]
MKNVYILLFVVPFFSFSQSKMVKFEVNDDISYLVPESFNLMSQSDRMQKFVSSRVPLAMHSSVDRSVDFGVNWNPIEWKEGAQETLYGFYKASIQSMFDEVEFIQDEVKKINGREFIVFEFIGSLESENAFSSKSSRSYTYIQYTSYNDQVLL